MYLLMASTKSFGGRVLKPSGKMSMCLMMDIEHRRIGTKETGESKLIF
jgi:hypothetical protein